jgi:hypothetical protein
MALGSMGRLAGYNIGPKIPIQVNSAIMPSPTSRLGLALTMRQAVTQNAALGPNPGTLCRGGSGVIAAIPKTS